jgi:outer membrane receptor protein involved in Fe transport
VTVEEERQEGFATWTWKPTPKWTLENGVTVETSTISQTGDTSASRTLTYWKPSFQVSRQLGRDQVRAKLFRDVSQLNFGDFASSAELGDNSISGGNPDLRPQSLWRLEGVLDKRFGEKGALTVTIAHEWVEDATDLVPIFDPGSGSFFDAPGNIGKGENTKIEVKATVPLDGFITGGQIEAFFALDDTEVTDPTTLQPRPISDNNDSYYELSFRQDLPAMKLAWGAAIEKGSELRQFRVAERETYEEGPFVDAFAETTRFGKAKVRIYASNLLDTEFRRERRFFAPNRAGAFDHEELRERQFGRIVGIKVSGNF